MAKRQASASLLAESFSPEARIDSRSSSRDSIASQAGEHPGKRRCTSVPFDVNTMLSISRKDYLSPCIGFTPAWKRLGLVLKPNAASTGGSPLYRSPTNMLRLTPCNLSNEDYVSEVQREPADEPGVPQAPTTQRPRRQRTQVNYAHPNNSDSGESEDQDSSGDTSAAGDTEGPEQDWDSDSDYMNPDQDPYLGDEAQEDNGDPEHDGDQVYDSDREDDEACDAGPGRTNSRAGNTGVERSLPPLSNIQDCIDDMMGKGLGLGLDEASKALASRPLRLGTMCSGTDSPIIFLDCLSANLKKHGHAQIRYDHVFSWEIEAVKQAFIERNFRPPIIFRDVREIIIDGAEKATTAYGAEVEIPRDLDLLIAGFSCKDLSSLNNNKKSVKGNGETADTWKGVHSYTSRFRPRVVLLENVKAKRKVWNVVIKEEWEKINYSYEWLYVDSKDYYLPQTRLRMYMIAVDNEFFREKSATVLKTWSDTMHALVRPCSSPFKAWIGDDDCDPQNFQQLVKEPEWVLSKQRCYQERVKYKLGMKRTITNWSESGFLRPLDWANHAFYRSQVPRVHECIEIAYARAAQLGFDAGYKMSIWDVSQNVDRFKTKPGIAPCVTPYAMQFITSSHTVVTGHQSLLLQGMPQNLIFGNETQKQLQDLAGNQMSTTVIGASMISTVIAANEYFTKTSPSKPQAIHTDLREKTVLVAAGGMQTQNLASLDVKSTHLKELINDAWLSSKLCSCEDTVELSNSSIKRCEKCDHTACSACSGHPKHVYAGLDSYIARDARKTPGYFQRKWRSRFPARVNILSFPDLSEAFGPSPDSDSKAFLRQVQAAKLESQPLCLQGLERMHGGWNISYASTKVNLEIRIDDKVRWSIFIRCPVQEPDDSTLREWLAQPLFRGLSKTSILDVEWEVRIPKPSTYRLKITTPQSHDFTHSWRNRMGLPRFKHETMPRTLCIRCDSNGSATLAGLDEVVGTFDLLKSCGTAMNSLYKKTGTEVDATSLYLFLDPDPIGPQDQDLFVFSKDCTRIPYGQKRDIIGHLDPSFRPWTLGADQEQEFELSFPGFWSPQKSIAVQPANPPSHILWPSQAALSSFQRNSCAEALTALDIRTDEILNTENVSHFAWVFEYAEIPAHLSQWHSFDSLSSKNQCDCSPKLPQILWSVGKGGATPREERQAASLFERQVKTRRPIVEIQVPSRTNIVVGINVASLAHRAIGKLHHLLPRRTRQIDSKCTWRLVPHYSGQASGKRFPRFKLSCNTLDAPYSQETHLNYELFEEQKKSLQWMKSQEKGIELIVAEVEEEVHPEMGWRVEAKAETTLEASGGILADLPSFGKTVLTIALVASEFLPENMPEEKPESKAKGKVKSRAKCKAKVNAKDLPHIPRQPLSLIDLSATLIVCPPHLAKQWMEEFKSSWKYSGSYHIILLERYSDLTKKYTIAQFQSAAVVIVSWNLLADKNYIDQLARFSAAPPPVLNKGRAFDTWLNYISERMPGRIDAFYADSNEDFDRNTDKKLEALLSAPEFNQSVPLKVFHGKAYPGSNAKVSGPQRLTSEAVGQFPASKEVPFLQMFRFKRIVVDEYHYLLHKQNASAFSAVKSISAHRRWALSGTPALTNFSDINQMAAFIGVSLGRDACGDGTITTDFEKGMALERTDVENFLVGTEIVSHAWNKSRHEMAQNFLDKFVRQNEPDLRHIRCSEVLRPVELSLEHAVVNLELTRHLASHGMQIRKMAKSSADRPERFNEILKGCNSGEEALLKSAFFYKAERGNNSISQLVRRRDDELSSGTKTVRDAAIELLTICEERIEDPSDLSYIGFRLSIHRDKVLRDDESRADVLQILREIEKHHRCLWDVQKKAEVDWIKTLKEKAKEHESKTKEKSNANGKGKAKDDEKKELTKEEEEEMKRKNKLKETRKRLVAKAYEAALDYTSRKRSLRFLLAIKDVLPALNPTTPYQRCDSPDCIGTCHPSKFSISSQCGHKACDECLQARSDEDACVAKGCELPLFTHDQVNLSDFGSIPGGTLTEPYGQKLAEICKLLHSLPRDDQAIVFVPNEMTAGLMEEALSKAGISKLSLGTGKKQAATTLEQFKANRDPDDQDWNKVLILNLNNESAAGANLTNANHVIFASPLLAQNQYEYESSMAQAIARCRRYGQQKVVKIYHFAALRTIDVDILEHRMRLSSPLETPGFQVRGPYDYVDPDKKEKTRMVRSDRNVIALVPVSWLKIEDVQRSIQMKLTLSSIIRFAKGIGQFQDND